MFSRTSQKSYFPVKVEKSCFSSKPKNRVFLQTWKIIFSSKPGKLYVFPKTIKLQFHVRIRIAFSYQLRKLKNHIFAKTWKSHFSRQNQKNSFFRQNRKSCFPTKTIKLCVTRQSSKIIFLPKPQIVFSIKILKFSFSSKLVKWKKYKNYFKYIYLNNIIS